MKKKSPTYEENLARLLEISEEIEDSDTPLEDSIALYKEGLKLAEECGKILSRCEKEVLTLQAKADKTFELKEEVNLA